jgi:hypothetical protein
MSHDSHDLQFSVLEPLVLEYALDGGIFTRGRELRLEDDSKGPIPNNLALCVLQVPRLACDAILHLLPNDLYWDIQLVAWQSSLHKTF